jgi:hypothetical protein
MALDVLERFARDVSGERMLQPVNDAAPAVAASIGDRAGLFDRVAGLPPASSRTIAGAANLLYTRSCKHRMSASFAAGGHGLGATWGRERALQLLVAAGAVTVEMLAHGPIDYYNTAGRAQ